MKVSKNLALVFAASSLWAGAALASETPEYVNIQAIAHGGTGCNQNTVGQTIAADRKSFTLLFDEFIVESGQGISGKQKRKNCNISVSLEFPQGWTYSIVGFDYRGFADLDPGVSASLTSSYYFQGSEFSKSFDKTFDGQLTDDFIISDTFGVDAVVWSDCKKSKPLNIETELYVNNPKRRSKYGMMSIDSLDGKVGQQYHMQWKRCDAEEEETTPLPPPSGMYPLPPGLNPSDIKINSITHGGSGCKQDTIGKMIASDGTSFTLIYDDFIVELGPDVSRRESRKFCQLTVDMDYPEGWTYTLVSLDYRGFFDLDESVVGHQETKYYFQGETQEIAFASDLYGQQTKDYQYRDVLAIDALYSPCNERKPLNIKTDIRLANTDRRNHDASGIMTVDSTDLSLSHTFGIRWERCR